MSIAHNKRVSGFGAIALGQQVDMWLANARPNLLPSVANFAYPQDVIHNPESRFRGEING